MGDSTSEWLLKPLFLAAASTLIVAVVGYFTNWYGLAGTPNRPIIKVVALNVSNYTYGQTPFVQLDVENVGGQTASNCVATWWIGMNHGNSQLPATASTRGFALRAGERQSFSLTSPVSVGFHGRTSSSAQARCDGITSEVVKANLFVV